MFGYTKAFVPNLRFREYDKYKAYYCGVCKTMGKLLGQGSRLSLTYEAATLAMLVDYCSFEGQIPLKKGRCGVHPGHSHPYFYGTPGIVYASRVNILLSGLDNLIVTPHIAWGSYKARSEIIRQMAEHIAELKKQN